MAGLALSLDEKESGDREGGNDIISKENDKIMMYRRVLIIRYLLLLVVAVVYGSMANVTIEIAPIKLLATSRPTDDPDFTANSVALVCYFHSCWFLLDYW